MEATLLGNVSCSSCNKKIRPSLSICTELHIVCPHCGQHCDIATENGDLRQCSGVQVKCVFLNSIFKNMIDSCQNGCGYQGEMLSLEHHETVCYQFNNSSDCIIDKVPTIKEADDRLIDDDFHTKCTNEDDTCEKELTHLTTYKGESQIFKQDEKKEYEAELSGPDSCLGPIVVEYVKNEFEDMETTCSPIGVGIVINKSENLPMNLDCKPVNNFNFVCSYCNKCYTTRANLTRHLPIHAAVKPYVCVVCEKGFSRSDHFKKHMETHSKRKTRASVLNLVKYSVTESTCESSSAK